MSKVVGKLDIKELYENLFTSQTIQKKQRLELDCALHTSLIEKRLSHSYQSKHHRSIFVTQYYYSSLVLELIWRYSNSWVSNIGDLVLVFIFWSRIIKCRWFSILVIIARNFLKIGNVWAIVVKYPTTVVYVGTHFFLQFLENSRSYSNAYNLIFSKNIHN